jgi:hypothetical protein
LEVKPELENIADRYNGARATGNYLSAALVGAAKETVTSTLQAPRLAWEIAENAWQSEKIGPNLKILATLAALPAAALSVPVGPFFGAYQGVSSVMSANRKLMQENPLRSDSSAALAKGILGQNNGDGLEADEPSTMTGHFCQSLEEFGEAKLGEGQKPFDVPLLSPVFSVVGGILSGAISGCVGAVAGLVAGSITCVKEMKDAVTGEGSIGQFVAAPLHVVAMPISLAWSGVKEATPRGFVDGWDHGPVRPVVDTVKSSAGLAAAVVKEAWER